MQVVLVMFRSDGERRSFSITRDVTVLGRREDCDLRIPLSDVSRKHCRFLRDGEVMRIEDLGSANGTYHNGSRVQEAELAPGDTIQVGPVVFCIQIDGLPAEEDMTPMLPAAEGSPHGESGDAAIEEGGPPPLPQEEEFGAGEVEELAEGEEASAEAELEMPDLEAEDDHSAQADLLGEAETIDEEPLEIEDPAPARSTAPPPLPSAAANPPPLPASPLPLEMEEEAISIEEESAVEGETVDEGSTDIVEDFEIFDEEETGGHDGDIKIDSEHP